MKHTAIATMAVLLGALAFANTASAGTRTDEFDITIESVPQCTLWDFFSEYQIPWNASGTTVSVPFSVVCNDELPYNLEIDSNPGGTMILVDSAIGEQEQITVQIINYDAGYNATAWGSLANGEQVDNVGTGIWQNYLIALTYNNPVRPKNGTYTRNANVTLNF